MHIAGSVHLRIVDIEVGRLYEAFVRVIAFTIGSGCIEATGWMRDRAQLQWGVGQQSVGGAKKSKSIPTSSYDLKIFNLKQVYEASYVQSMGSYFLICRMYETKLLPDEFVIKEYVSLHKFGTFKTRPKIDLEVRALVQRAKLKS